MGTHITIITTTSATATTAVSMKLSFVTVLCALVLAAFAVNTFKVMVQNEVTELYAADPNMSVAQCQVTCDAIFNLLDPHDEAKTDHMCAEMCNCVRNSTCN